MCEGPDALLERAASVWANARVVYDGPTGVGKSDEWRLVEAIAERPDCESGLVALLSSPRHLVAAYAVVALHEMGRPALAGLPNEWLARREAIELRCGCFRRSSDLGSLACQYQKEAGEDLA